MAVASSFFRVHCEIAYSLSPSYFPHCTFLGPSNWVPLTHIPAMPGRAKSGARFTASASSSPEAGWCLPWSSGTHSRHLALPTVIACLQSRGARTRLGKQLLLALCSFLGCLGVKEDALSQDIAVVLKTLISGSDVDAFHPTDLFT